MNLPRNNSEDSVQQDLLEVPAKKTKKTEYRSTDYVTGDMSDKEPKSEVDSFVQFYMRQIYIVRGIDYIMPVGRIGKYYKRAKYIIQTLGGIERAKRFVGWYLQSPSFANSGYGIDLMVSTPVINQYLAAHPSVTREGISTRFVDSTEREDKGKVVSPSTKYDERGRLVNDRNTK